MPKTYTCDNCDFICSKFSNYTSHTLTRKHRKNAENAIKNAENAAAAEPVIQPEVSIQADPQIPKKIYNCKNCDRPYNNYQCKWRHQKYCSVITEQDKNDNICLSEHSTEQTIDAESSDDEPKSYITNEKMCEILKEICISNAQNAEFQKQNAEFQTKFFEFMKEKQVSNITNNNNNNIQINIDTFLNQCCDGAMSLNNFIKNLQVSLEDVFYMASHGNKNGIVAVITRELDKQTLIERPFHCTDAKRHITYVKEDAGWIKTQDQKPLLNLCYQIQHKCAVKSNEIFRADPRYAQSGTKETEVAVHILIETNGGRQGYEHNHGLAANILENKYHVNKEQMKEAIMK